MAASIASWLRVKASLAITGRNILNCNAEVSRVPLRAEFDRRGNSAAVIAMRLISQPPPHLLGLICLLPLPKSPDSKSV